MKILNVEQNTPEWHELRRTHIGASDAPIIMGVSPYMTPLELWRYKLENLEPQGFQDNEILKKGHECEIIAREIFNNTYNTNLKPCVCQSDSRQYCIASLDGLDIEKNLIVEFKYVGKQDFDNGKILQHHEPQLLHQCYVCETDRVLYVLYNDFYNTIKVIEYLRDEKKLKTLLKKEEEFYKCMTDKVPPEPTDKDFYVVDDSELSTLIDEYKKLNEELKNLEQKQKELKDKILNHEIIKSHQRVLINDTKIFEIVRRGSIDTQRLQEELKIDLEKYRKENIKYWIIK
jgi:putative phage-type endonuclease